MVDVFEHSARLDTAAIEERRDLVQVVSDGGKLQSLTRTEIVSCEMSFIWTV